MRFGERKARLGKRGRSLANFSVSIVFRFCNAWISWQYLAFYRCHIAVTTASACYSTTTLRIATRDGDRRSHLPASSLSFEFFDSFNNVFSSTSCYLSQLYILLLPPSALPSLLSPPPLHALQDDLPAADFTTNTTTAAAAASHSASGTASKAGITVAAAAAAAGGYSKTL